MAKYLMKPAGIVIPAVLYEGHQVVELDPKPTSRYVVHVEVGDMSPSQAMAALEHTKKGLAGFFPKGTVLYVPCRNAVPVFQIFELEQVGDVLEEKASETFHQTPF